VRAECQAGACVSLRLEGTAGVACRLDEVAVAPICGDEAVPARLQEVLTLRADKARRLVEQAAQGGRSRARLRAADRMLSAVQKQARRTRAKGLITRDCRDRIDAAVRALRGEVRGLRTP
jgi:hypothetical protein